MEDFAPQEKLPELETLCPECEGAGGSVYRNEYTPCHECDGAGYLPTEFGKKFVAMMRHNFRPMLRRFANEK